MKNTVPVILSFFLLFSISAFSASNGCGVNDCWANSSEIFGENVCVVCPEGETEIILLEGLPETACNANTFCERLTPTCSRLPNSEIRNQHFELHCYDDEDIQ